MDTTIAPLPVNLPKKIRDAIDTLDRSGITYETIVEPWPGGDTMVRFRVRSAGRMVAASAAWIISEPRSWDRRPCRTASYLGGGYVMAGLRKHHRFAAKRAARGLVWVANLSI